MKRIPFGISASNAMNVQNNGNGNKNSKRKADSSPGQEVKRCALGDISNAKKSVIPIPAKGKATLLKPEQTRVTRQSVKKILPPKLPSPKQGISEAHKIPITRAHSVRLPNENSLKPKLKGRKSESSGNEESDDSLLYKTASDLSDSVIETFDGQSLEDLNKKNEKLTKAEKQLPEGVVDFDAETGEDPYQVALYAPEIFEYYKFRELKFPVSKYLTSQTELNKGMRTILVDWMVEVQESFELNHETLYLAVKIIDIFLGKVKIPRDKLQLVGTTSFWIAAKFDERIAPSIDDFCYICDDAYPMSQVLTMEIQILKALKYDIGFPLSYRFLRRYARVAKLEMEALTLARFILESALMEYDFVDVRDSMMAGAALWLALYMKGSTKPWCPTLTYYSGYSSTDLFDLANRLLAMLRNPPTNVKTIRSKYSHTVFYEVAKIPLPEEIRI